MSTVACAPPQAPPRNGSGVPGLGQCCRARHIVVTLGGRFTFEFGIDVDRDAREVDRWALAATLLGDAAAIAAAVRTYRLLEYAGIEKLGDVPHHDRCEVVRLLAEGGYDGRVASELLTLSEAVEDRYPRGLAAYGADIADPSELAGALTALPGWNAVAVGTFLRELRGVWPGADVPLDPRAAQAARHAALPADFDELSSVAAAADVDMRDLEAGLVRLAAIHELEHCPGGEECPLVQVDREQFVHF